MTIDPFDIRNLAPDPPSEVPAEAIWGGYFLDDEQISKGSFVTRYRHPEWGLGWVHFNSPKAVFQATEPSMVEATLRHAFGGAGVAAVLLPYEAAPSLHSHLSTRAGDLPFLAWVALYEPTGSFYKELGPCEARFAADRYEADFGQMGGDASTEYLDAFGKVRRSLADGETYQVNLTQRLRFRYPRSAWKLFVSRNGIDPPPYATFVHGGDWQVASWSPELFLERKGATVRMKPMKGTAPRSAPRESLLTPKTFAENLMIVDMVRNDLGSVADVGSVNVPRLFDISAFRSVWQMTSTVQAAFGGCGFELLKAAFPPASVTGAPKAAACGVIERLERSPRGLYCGALGYVTPSGDMRLSVGIRTAFVTEGMLSYGVGSGIVWDSDAGDEFAEWRVKTAVLTERVDQWALLETMDPFQLISSPPGIIDHMARLRASCHQFGIPFDKKGIKKELRGHGTDWTQAQVNRVRLTQTKDGRAHARMFPARRSGTTLCYRVASWPVSSLDPSLRYKTTSRQVYQEHLDVAADCDEVLLFNERGEATEFTTGALLAKFGEEWVTPSVESGCLPSVGIAKLEIQRGYEPGLSICRRAIAVAELESAAEIWMVNARGRWPMRRAAQ